MRRSRRLESIASNDVNLIKTESKAVMKQISIILKKDASLRTTEEIDLLLNNEEIAAFLSKRKVNNKLVKEREQEIEDVATDLEEKCRALAAAIEESRSLVIYTGAGISTAASIPDYRGPQGVWTLLKQGKECRTTDLSLAEPTYTHMAIAELYRRGYVKRIVSQNCDGLHLRSGLPRTALSELHGNMFLEVCRTCQPVKEYLRLFDVTERTGMRRHKTGRLCVACRSPLLDTIVHFGEKSPFQSPHNWQQAANCANRSDLILCLGSSLKVLKKYACLWATHKPLDEQPKLIIVNLQWTPKDKKAYLKINGRCDDVLKRVTSCLNIEVHPYNRYSDPLFHLAVPLLPHDANSTSKAVLPVPDDLVKRSPEELKVAVQRRKSVVKSALSRSEDEGRVLNLIDRGSLESLMRSRYHGDDRQIDVRRQPARVAKVKQFLVRTKRRLEGEGGSPSKIQKLNDPDDLKSFSNASLSSCATPNSSTWDLDNISGDVLKEIIVEEAKNTKADFSEKFLETLEGLSTNPIIIHDSSSDSSCSLPFDQSDAIQYTSFGACPPITPPPSNGPSSLSSVDCITVIENDIQCIKNPLVTIDCDYASVEEVTSTSALVSDRNHDLHLLRKMTDDCPTLTTPGWFGKGMQVRKMKRKRTSKKLN